MFSAGFFGSRAGLLVAAALALPGNPARAQQPIIRRVYVTNAPRQDSMFALGNTITLEVTGLNRWLKYQEAVLVAQGLTPEKAHAKARALVLYLDDAPLLNMPPLALYVNESATNEVLMAKARRAIPAAAPAATTVPAALSDSVRRPPPASPDSTAAAVPTMAAAVPTMAAAVPTMAAAVPTMAAAVPTMAAAAGQPASPLSLLLDEYPIGVPDKIVFRLVRDIANYQYWNMAYSSPWDESSDVRIGLGYEDRIFTQLHPQQAGRSIHLQLVERGTFWTAVVGTGVLGVGLLALGVYSWLLRVTLPRSSSTAPMPTLAAAHPPFSLAKVQMAWWTFIILGSFLVIYCVSGELPDVSTTSLALLGISGGTAALNGLIKRDPPPAEATTGPWLTSRGWLTDILSDAHGVSMNRLQQVVISLLMGYFFVRTVYNSVAMPVWTDNQVLLLGVSNATYLGLEWQGSRTRDDAAPAADPAPAAALPVPAAPAPPPAAAGPLAATPFPAAVPGDDLPAVLPASLPPADPVSLAPAADMPPAAMPAA